MLNKEKTKIAIFDLTGCEGCQFNLFALDELLLDFFQSFEITNWRLLAEPEKKNADFDIAFIEGAVTTKKHIKLLRQIRETSKIVVSMGACAISGNIFAQIDEKQREKLAKKIYGKNYKLKAKFLKPVDKFITVDEKIPGCPADLDQFKKLLKKIGKKKITSKIKKVSSPDFTSRIEGHGVLKINFKNKSIKFDVEEGERLVEGLLLGKNFMQAPFITSRICGICPTAHNLCSLAAIEDAFDIKISQNTIMLREILSAGQTIKSHILHLFFLVLPDYAGLKSSIELSKKYPAEFHLMLNLKKIADEMLKVVGGSSAFPMNTTVGGFKTTPNIKNLLAIRSSIFDVIDESEDIIKLFADIKIPQLKVNMRFATITPIKKTYPFYQGNFIHTINEITKKGSTAKLGLLNGKVIKVGALSRLSFYSDTLKPKANQIFKNLKLELKNPFNNNIAQAIEILHLLENTADLIETLGNKNLKNSVVAIKQKLPKKAVNGKASLEAPRGILLHQIKINAQGNITHYNITPPTQINLASLEKEAHELIKQQSNLSTKQLKQQIQQLIRAFDPCITCAVH